MSFVIQKRSCHNRNSFFHISTLYALSTLPDLRQEVQTYIFLEPPSTLTLTDLTLDFHILLERLCE